MSEAAGEGGWERLFWLVFGQTSNPVALLDDQRCIVALNDAALALFGSSREELLGSSMADSVRPQERAVAEAEWQEFLRSGDYSGTRALLRGDGSEVRVAFAARLAQVGGRPLAIYVALSRAGRSRTSERARALPLTRRERQVVSLIALGRETPEIARELHISPETVRTHVRNAMARLGARTRAHLVAVVLCSEEHFLLPQPEGASA
jgi:PAS domain S-box-containing protein